MGAVAFCQGDVVQGVLQLSNPASRAMSYVVEVYLFNTTGGVVVATTGPMAAVQCASGSNVVITFSFTIPAVTSPINCYTYVKVIANGAVLMPAVDYSQPILLLPSVEAASIGTMNWS